MTKQFVDRVTIAEKSKYSILYIFICLQKLVAFRFGSMLFYKVLGIAFLNLVSTPALSEEIGCLDGEIIQQDIVFEDFKLTINHSEDCLYSKEIDRAAYFNRRERSKTQVELEVYMPGFIPAGDVIDDGYNAEGSGSFFKARIRFNFGPTPEMISSLKSRYIRNGELLGARGDYQEYQSFSSETPVSVYVPIDDSTYFVICYNRLSGCTVTGILPDFRVWYTVALFDIEYFDWKIIHRDIGDFIRESVSM